MNKFRVVHTDPQLHPLDKEQIDCLEKVGASIIPLDAGSRGLEVLAEADAILNADFRLDAHVIANLRNCRVIARFGTGVDNIDIQSATAHGILVVNVPEFCTDEVANRTFTLLLACSCQLRRLDQSVRDGKWRSPDVDSALEIAGQTLGLVGFGKIARAVAHRARAFRMKVLAYDPYVSPKAMEAEGVVPSALPELFSTSDFISLHAPLTAETQHVVSEKTLALVKDSAVLINCSRGGLVDEAALATALLAGRLAAAGLDVFETEPPSSASPLLKMDQVILTPHTAAHTPAALQRVRKAAVEDVVRVLCGQPPHNLVNPSIAQK